MQYALKENILGYEWMSRENLSKQILTISLKHPILMINITFNSIYILCQSTFFKIQNDTY